LCGVDWNLATIMDNRLRVLLVSPHFPPSNAPDAQRVRMVLPYLGEFGIEAEVLAVEPDQVEAPLDPWLEELLPESVPVHRVKALGLSYSKLPGFGTLSPRAYQPIRDKGDELLKDRSFDLVYFSTTQFGVIPLGPRWKDRFQVPFAMDYQDPWVNDYYRDHPEVRPPGGRLKYGVATRISRVLEPQILRECSGITSVSAAYPQQLRERYPWLQLGESGSDQEMHCKIMPFPGDERDLEQVKLSGITQDIFDPEDGRIHWVYAGRCGADMQFALCGLFGALRDLGKRCPEELAQLRLHFIGTSYAAEGSREETVMPVAREYGLEAIVEERTSRVPMSVVLKCLLDAHTLVLPGSDDPSYTASKIYPYLLAKKPLLAIFHQDSSVVGLIREVGGGKVVSFRTGEEVGALASRIQKEGLGDSLEVARVSLDPQRFAPHTAREQARSLSKFFRHCASASERLSRPGT